MRERPWVICHMVPSLDGRIVTKGWNLPRVKRRRGGLVWLRYQVRHG